LEPTPTLCGRVDAHLAELLALPRLTAYSNKGQLKIGPRAPSSKGCDGF
jgi:hypothetical protein